ncbi:hypothetical protein Tco_0377598 [Tanacetum coccineum]
MLDPSPEFIGLWGMSGDLGLPIVVRPPKSRLNMMTTPLKFGPLAEIAPNASVKTHLTPPNNLGLDLAGKPVNATLYRGMIGSLMYLTASRLDIQFSTCLCARYQSNPKESHLIAMKRIFMYLKGTPTLEKALQVHVNCLEESCTSRYPSFMTTSVPLLYPTTLLFIQEPNTSISDVTSSRITFSKEILNYTSSPLNIREFQCTALVEKPTPANEDSEPLPLKESGIRFTLKNRGTPLYIGYKTFCQNTRLEYNNGQYVDFPQTEAIKAELLKLGLHNYKNEDPEVLELGGNKSSTDQLNSNQHMIVFSVLTGTKIDIGEIIYNDLVTRFSDGFRNKYVAYPRFISYVLERLLNTDYT